MGTDRGSYFAEGRGICEAPRRGRLTERKSVHQCRLSEAAEPEAGLSIVEADTGQGVLGTVEVFEGVNPVAEVRNRVAVLEPFAGLAPNTRYSVTFGVAVCAAMPR